MQAGAGRRFQVDRDAVGQLHGAVELVVFDAGHDLQVDVAAVALLAADDVGGIQDFVLRGHGALDDAAGQEESVDLLGALQGVKRARHFVRRESYAFGLGAPGAEDAVMAVALAGGGHHGLEHRFGTARRLQVGDAVAEVEFLLATAAYALGLRAVAAWLMQGDIAHLRELGQGFGDETASHASSV